jgi:O-antigen/teichoic acid export membrane protein
MSHAFSIRMALAVLRSQYAIVIVETVALTVLTFVSFSVLVRLTDMKTIGLWVLLNSLLGFARIADFWSTGLISFVAQSVGEGRKSDAARMVSTAMMTSGFGYLVLTLVAWLIFHIFAGSIPGVEDKELVRHILPLMCTTFWLLAMASTYQVGFLGFNQPGLKAIQTVAGGFLFLLFSILFIPQFGLWGILIAQAMQALFMLGFGFIIFHFNISRGFRRFEWNRADFKNLIGYGGKATAVNVLQVATDPLIRLLVSSFGGLAAVTVVESATRLILAVRGVIISVGQILIPAFARASDQADHETERLYSQARKMFSIFTLFSSACLLSVAPLLEHVLLGGRQVLFLPSLWLLCLGWGVNTAAAPAYFLLTGHRNLRPLFLHRLLQLLGVAILGVLGGMMFGVLGVITGVSLGLIASAIILFLAAQKFEQNSGNLNWGLPSLAWIFPIFTAAISSSLCVAIDKTNAGQTAFFMASLVGLVFTLLVCFWTLPLRPFFHDRSPGG